MAALISDKVSAPMHLLRKAGVRTPMMQASDAVRGDKDKKKKKPASKTLLSDGQLAE